MKSARDKCWCWGLESVATTLAVVITAAASQQDKDAGDIARLTTGKQPSPPPTSAGADRIDGIALERLKRARMNVKKVDIFSAKSWYVPPPPAAPLPPAPPTAPPLPFTFLGKMLESEGKLTIVLAGDNRVYLVSEGDTINDTYSVDGVEEGKLALTYLPLQIKQYINIGEAP